MLRAYIMGMGFALLYLATLTQVHTFDALSYVLSVERKPWQAVFHPHHLAYGPLGVLALHIGQVFGYAGGAALPMQLVNALAGALGVALFAGLVLKMTRRFDLALAMGLLLGGSYAYWYYAVEIEVYTAATLFLILCLGLLWRLVIGERSWLFVLLGLSHAAAILFHQTNVLLAGPILVLAGWMLWQDRPGWKRIVGGWVSYAATLMLVVLLTYLWVGFGVSGFANWQDFWVWLTEYARTGWWGGPVSATNWERLSKGLAETWTVQGGGWAWLLMLACGIVGLWGNRGAGEQGSRGTGEQGNRGAGEQGSRGAGETPSPKPQTLNPKQQPSSFKIMGIVLLVWLLIYGSFFFWWEPDNIEFWIASLPVWLMLLGFALRHLRPWHPAIMLLLLLAVLILGLNYDAIRRRGDASTDLQRTIARALGEQSTPADLLIIPDGLQELYLPYYEKRENFMSINQALFDQGADWDRACESIQQRIEIALHAGATALIAQEALQPPATLLERHRLGQAQVDACFAQYRAALRPVAMPEPVPAYQRLLYAQEYADGPGWRFETGPLGWQAANVRDQRFDGGWAFVPERDPSITSPLLRLDTSKIDAIEIEIVNETGAQDAQLFFLGEDGLASEERSLRWRLEPGQHSYRLELKGVPGWQGIVTRLRIDPVGVGDGGRVRVVRCEF